MVSSEIKDGKYSVENLTPGSTNVTVLTIPPTKAGAMPSGKSAVAAHESATPPGKYVPIPKRYALPDQSGLTFEVQPGSQTKDFDLTP